MESERKDQNEKLGESVNWPDFLNELWQKGNTASNLSKKGVAMEIGGETFIVQHNRRDTNAFLRFQSASDPAKKVFVILRNAYFLVGRKKRYGRPEINPVIQISTELHGHMSEDSDFVTRMDDGAGADEVHETLQALGQICDITIDIKRFRLNWDGDITQLFPHSLLDQLYEMVRISPEGELVFNNYKALANNGHTREQYERASSVGIQKAINLHEGTVTEHDAEDIEVYITDERIRTYVEDVIKKTNMSPHHPLFRQLYDFYCSILLQVKSTRDHLRHLVPVQPNEPLRVRIGSDKKQGHAYFEKRATKRGRKARFLNLEEEHHHAYMTYPPNRYKTFDPKNPVNLEINPISLQAETRHHIHYMNLDALERKLPHGIQGLGITEMVDDMQYFPATYRKKKRAPQLSPLVQLSDAINSRKYREWWLLMILVDAGNIPGINGHMYTEHVLHSLAEKFAKRVKPLTPEEFEMIDEAVFDFLSNVEDKEVFMGYLGERIKRIQRFKDIDAPKICIRNEMTALRAKMNLSPEAPIHMQHFRKVVAQYQAYKEQLKILATEYAEYEDSRSVASWVRLDAHMELCIREQKDLAEFMTKYMPFRAPDGKNYPSPAAYYLNPKVLYEEIIRRYPQLAG